MTRLGLALTTLVICAAAGVFGVWLATRGEESAASGPHGADRAQQRLVDLALEHVPGGAGLQGLVEELLVLVHGEHEHAHIGPP